MNRYLAAAAALIAGLLSISHANAQLAVAKVVATCGTVSPTPHVGNNYPLTIDITGTLCSVGGGGGGGGGTSSNFGAAFPGAGTAAGFEYLTSAPTLTNGQMVAGQTDINGNLKVNVVTGGGANASIGTNGAAAPGSSTQIGILVGSNLQPVSAANPIPTSGGNVIQATASVPVNISTATTTLLVAASGSTAIYVTNFNVMGGGTGNFTLEYGTGATCTGTHALTGAYPITAQSGVSVGAIGPALVVPASNALCAVTSAAVQMSGSVAYAQF